MAATLAADLEPGGVRLGVVAGTVTDLRAKLGRAAGRLADPACKAVRDASGVYFFGEPLYTPGSLALMFPGEGAQYLYMLADLCGAASDLEWMQPAIGAGDAVAGATTSADVDEGKPAPDLLTVAVEQHGLDPARTVVVGDTVWDVEAARAAGLPCIGLTCGGISEAELREAGAVAVCADPADLLDHLDDTPLGRAV